MWKTIVLPNIFVKMYIYIIFSGFFPKEKIQNSIYLIQKSFVTLQVT